MSTGMTTAVPPNGATRTQSVPHAGAYVTSPALADATHAELRHLLATGTTTRLIGEQLGGGVNGGIPLMRVEDPADPTRWVHAAMQDHAHGGAFDILGHDVAVATNLEEFVVPSAWRDDLTAGLTLQHAGNALDQTTIVSDDGAVTRGIAGWKSLQNNLRHAAIDNGLSGAEALAHANRSIQGVQLTHGMLGSADAHGGNLLLDLDGSPRPHMVGIDFGLAGQFDDLGFPKLHQEFVPSVPVMDAELDEITPKGARFMELDQELVERLRNRDDQALRDAFQAYRMRTARAPDVGSAYRFVPPADAPAGVEKIQHRDFPGKVGFKAKVQPLNYDKWGRIMDNIASIARRGGMAFIAK